MKSCTYTKDELGNDVAIYSNGFTFTGILNNSNPVKGTIKDDKGHLVYEGEIECDIYWNDAYCCNCERTFCSL